MKKVLLSALALCACVYASAQGRIHDNGLYDDFKKASEYSDEYSVETDKKVCVGDPATEGEENAYRGIFVYGNKDVEIDGFGLKTTRNMEAGQLEIEVEQLKGQYEPFGFIFGTYCEGSEEKDFTMDLSDNAVISFHLKVEQFEDLYVPGDGVTTEELGVQVKIQVTDINDVTLAFDESWDGVPGNAWQYEIGVSGDGSKPSNDFFNSANRMSQGDEVQISYDLKRALPANDANDAPDPDKTFDYSQVVAVKITFANARKDSDDGYAPYHHKGLYIIKDFRLGSEWPVGLFAPTVSAALSVYPNPASDRVNFEKELTNINVFNAQGQLIETISSARSINVSSYNKGVYFINATEGTSRILVK